MHIDTEALRASLERLRQEPHEADLLRPLQRVVTSINRPFAYDGAGIMLIDQSEELVYVAASVTCKDVHSDATNVTRP